MSKSTSPLGSSFDSLLDELGIRKDVETEAVRALVLQDVSDATCNMCRWADFDAGEPPEGGWCDHPDINSQMPMNRCGRYEMDECFKGRFSNPVAIDLSASRDSHRMHDITTLLAFHDGSSLEYWGCAGGAHPLGLFGTITLAYRRADGSTEVLHYTLTSREPALSNSESHAQPCEQE